MSMPSRRARVSFAGEDRGLAGLDDVLGAPDRARGVEGQDLADDEPVEEHPQRREVLLDGRGRARPGELLDVGRDHHRLDLVESRGLGARTTRRIGARPRGRRGACSGSGCGR